jgi:predicted acyltransferase (DUF342 family)
MSQAWIADGLRRVEAGHLVGRFAVVPGLRCKDAARSLWVGDGATVQGDIQHAGSVVLGARVRVVGAITAGHEVILGAATQVGRVQARGRIVVQAGARAGDLEAGGDVLLLGDAEVGIVTAGGDVLVAGAPRSAGMRPGGRVTTRPW